MKRGLLLLAAVLTPTAAHAQREVTPEARLFREYRDGVFTIFGDAGHGSGFLISESGLVLTNQHVVANSRYVRVQINDSIKVAAAVVAVDSAQDVAVLRVHPSVVEGLPVLKIAPRREELAFEGERVIAIGSPLNQTKIVTSGIVSKVERNAIISDVNINPGNSGGPLLNMDGEVVAINTFGDVSRSGPGVSGSISIYLALPTIEAAEHRLASAGPPSPERLPVMPRAIFPLKALEAAAAARWWDDDAYNVSKIGRTGNFEVRVFSPPFIYRTEKQGELRLAEARRQREAKAGASPADSYSPFEDLKSWAQYAGFYAPVVLAQISPKVGETTGSAIANALGAFAAGYSGTVYRGTHKLEFKADLHDVAFERSGVRIVEIERGMIFVPLDVSMGNYYDYYYGKDLARAGVFTLDPMIFAPEGSTWPQIFLTVEDLKKPDSPTRFALPRRTVERIWADFAPYREQLAADTARLVVNVH